MYAGHKNSYLQLEHIVNSRIINRCVDKALETPTQDVFQALPPFHRLASEQPCIPIHNCDVTRRPLAFGRGAMPKLIKEMNSDNICQMHQAITSICDLVHDPEHALEAIKHHFAARTTSLIQHKDERIRKCCLEALTGTAYLYEGKVPIVKNRRLLKNLKDCLRDKEIGIRFQVGKLLNCLSTSLMIADTLVGEGFIESIVKELEVSYEHEDKEVQINLLQSLHQMMYCSGNLIAMDCNLFCLLLKILQKQENPRVIGVALKCLSDLLQTSAGRAMALQTHVLKRLYQFLLSDDEEIYENAAGAILFATHTLESLVKAAKLPKLIDRLLELVAAVHQPTTQKYCMQILANLTGHGKIKKYFLDTKYLQLTNIPVNDKDEDAKRLKHILLTDSLGYC